MKNILITGGSSGIGYGLVKKFLDNEYQVFAISRNINSLKQLNNKHLTIIQADITNLDDREKILTIIKDLDLDIINNAGYGAPEIFKDSSINNLRSHFEVNFFAPIELLQKLLRQNKVARVLNMSSGAAEIPLQSLIGYCTSKAAIQHAIKCLNLEYPETKFINLRPGMVDTPLQERWRLVDEKVFPKGNKYIEAKGNNELISTRTVAEFVFWVMNLPLEEFARQDWNIYMEEHHQYWLKPNSLFDM